MKKLLSAVTSAVMGLSLVTSAFASTFTVSAAGSLSAAQPNVSLSEVQDVSANKSASAITVSTTTDKASYSAGEEAEVNLYMNSNGKAVASFSVWLNNTTPIKLTADYPCEENSEAFGASIVMNASAGKFNASTIEGTGAGKVPDSTKSMATLYFTIPAGTADGTYTITYDKFEVRESMDSSYQVTAEPITITVGAGGTTQSTTAPTAVTTTTTTRAASSNADIVIDLGNYNAQPGDEVDMIVTIDPKGNKTTSFSAFMKVDSPITWDKDYLMEETSEAYGSSIVINPNDLKFNFATLNGTQAMLATAGSTLVEIYWQVPDNCPDGTYKVSFDKFEVKNDDTVYNVDILNGNIVVGDSITSTTQTTAPATTTTTTTTKASGDADIVIDLGNYTAQPGDEVDMVVKVDPKGHKTTSYSAYMKVDSPITWDKDYLMEDTSEAYGSSIVINAEDLKFNFATLDGTQSMLADAGSTLVEIYWQVPDNCPDGTYKVSFDKFEVKDDAYVYSVDILNGNIEVSAGTTTTSSSTTTNTTTTTTTVPASTTSTTAPTVSTTAPQGTIPAAANGSAKWTIDTVIAAPGQKVTVDVYVDGNSTLPVSGAQFNVAAKAGVQYNSVSGKCAAYGNSDIVANADHSKAANAVEFAFAQGIGSANAAADKAKIMTLTYTAPTEPGTYPLTWDALFVSDEYGNDITSKVTVADGAIIVASADGAVIWDIPEVTAKPGEKVTMEVAVSADTDPLAVAGAQFVIKHDAAVAYSDASASSEAYKSDIVKNPAYVTNAVEFAFGEGKGDEIAASSGNVLTITYIAPDAAGTYPITWDKGTLFVSDGLGNDITDKVTVLDGSITVIPEDEPDFGKAEWIIPEKDAEPGDTVTMEVTVKNGTVAAAVAGAQFNITAADPIVYSTATGSAAYSADLVANHNRQEFAFATADGSYKRAADGDVVLVLTYTVPDTCPEGDYPVTWSAQFVTAEDKDLTDNITFTDGVIHVKSKTTTTTADDETTTTTAADESTTTTVADESTTTTAADESTTTTAADESTTTTAADESTTTTAADESTTTTAADESTTTTTQAGETTTTTVPVSTTTVTIPAGAIAWDIDDVVVAPGETVTLKVLVLDPNGSNMPVQAAQFGIVAVDPVLTGVSAQSAAYGAAIVSNPNHLANGVEVAFADATKVGTNGTTVLELTYTAPTEPGVYPVVWDRATFAPFVSSPDGDDWSKDVVFINGSITVEVPESSTTSEPADTTTTTVADESTTTTAADESTTTTAAETGSTTTTAADESTTTTAAETGSTTTTAAETGSTTTTAAETGSTTTTTGGAGETTTTTTSPVQTTAGNVVWQIAKTTVAPGATVELTMTIVDANNSGLEVSGAQFKLTPESPIEAEGAKGPYFYADVTAKSTDNLEYVFATSDGSVKASKDGEIVMTLIYKVPENCAAGTYVITPSDVYVNGADDENITARVQIRAGAITVVPGDTTVRTYGVVEKTYGFYFSHDNRVDAFSKNQITKLEIYDEYSVNGVVTKTEKRENVTVDDISYINKDGQLATPQNVYDEAQTDFFYSEDEKLIQIYYDGAPLLDADGNALYLEAYIGVKGDVSLNNMADPEDASLILVYNAKQVELDVSGDEVQISNSPLVKGADDPLDHFAAFLGDVNMNEYDPDNWRYRKGERMVDAVDSSKILVFNAGVVAQGEDPDFQAIWDVAAPERFG